jgi:hypothetical protein
MFENLDDKNPPQPRELLVELIVAEGARRRRRRAAAFAGGLASVLVLTGAIGLAQMRGQEPNVSTSNKPPETTTPAPDHDSGNGVNTSPSTSMHGDSETSAPHEATAFAGITPDGRVVLGDPATGAIVRRLVDAPSDGPDPNMCCVMQSPDGTQVYYVASSQETGSGSGDSKIYRVAATGGQPVAIATGSHPAISADGTYLAYTHNSDQIVVRNLKTDRERSYSGLNTPGATIQDLAFADTPNGKKLVFSAAAQGRPAELFTLFLSISQAASLADASRLGPPVSSPEGTGWLVPDGHVSDGLISVIQTCCALDSGGYAGDTSAALVDPIGGERQRSTPISIGSGAVIDAPYDPTGQNQLVLTIEDGTSTLSRRTAGADLERLDAAEQYVSIDW